ncbi:energy-coupling factor ABC transporter permease [Litoribacillus peritrichatus]|uniref:Energy-coupling factor ABC transporter permease n=1 Tax=Litoribacillus peritrichatus TaxID=718191 RepID=A0ABP7MF72_9GAMM
MHIEPGVVNGAKLLLSYGSSAVSFGIMSKLALDAIKQSGFGSLVVKSLLTTLFVFIFFEVYPKEPVGVSEVHIILGSTLFLIFGMAPAAIGLAAGLFIQGAFFAPFDLPQYGMNVTTLLMPLFAMSWVAKKVIPEQTAYKDLTYLQTLKLSAAYQGGIISWVAFWAFYGSGFGAENLASVGSFCLAYTSVILVEPLIDLAVLAGAKTVHRFKDSGVFERRLYNPAA